MHSESSDNDHDDDELVSERWWDNSDRDSSSTGWRSSLGSSFQRRGKEWRKEPCQEDGRHNSFPFFGSYYTIYTTLENHCTDIL